MTRALAALLLLTLTGCNPLWCLNAPPMNCRQPANAGIPADHVFALRRENEATCQSGAWSACWDDWPVPTPGVP